MRRASTARQNADTCDGEVAWSSIDSFRGGNGAGLDPGTVVVIVTGSCVSSESKVDAFASRLLFGICSFGAASNIWNLSKELCNWHI